MTDELGTLETVAREVAKALAPLEQHFSADNPLSFLRQLGVSLPPSLAADAQFTGALGSAAAAIGGLGGLVDALSAAAGDAAAAAQAGVALTGKLGDALSALGNIGPALSTAAASLLSGPELAAVQDFAGQLAEKVFGFAAIEYLRGRSAGTLRTLALAGLVDDTQLPGDPMDPSKPAGVLEGLHLDRLITLFLDPKRYLTEAFGFGGAGFDGTALFGPLAALLEHYKLPVRIVRPSSGPPIFEAFFFRLTTDPGTVPPSLVFGLRVPASRDFAKTVPLGPLWNLQLGARARFESGIAIEIPESFAISVTPPTGQAHLDVSAGLTAVKSAADPILVFGVTGGTRLTAEKLGFTVGFTGAWDSGTGKATGEPVVSGEVSGGRLVIDLSQADGFIATVLGGARVDGNFAFKLHWTSSTGMRIEGGSALQIVLPTHITLGPIDLQRLYLQLGLAASGADLSLPGELSTAFSANLGPLKASFDRIGLTITTTFPGHGGNLGPVNLIPGFKPPTGVGLSIDAGIVSGGGFLSCDPDHGEYSGALQLTFAGFLTLSAIGLINTRLPDGSPGFSLLVIITADFGTGLQLGFGFTLLAVGGLLGVNRGMLFQPIIDGVRSGAIESVMFPRDVVANAPRIISDLKAFFPPQPGTFLIGPMAKLGWGEPTLVSLSLGVIVEAPPGDIAILGVLRVALPAEELAILVLNVNFAGALEFSKQRLYFFASLYDSHVLFITIDGEMGVLFAWGSQADFVVSVGGFHPRFTPPPLPFPAPRRISVSIINQSFARIRADGYFAVTTNTVQFGTHAEYFFGFDALSVSGHSGFDALIQFSPFHFVVSIETSFAVKVFGMGVYGIDIYLTLEGPTPWHATGHGSLSFLFFSVSVPIDITFGDKRDTTLKPVDVTPILAGELRKRSNWLAVPPSGSQILVSLRALDPADPDLVLHPVGTLQVAQRAVPLNVKLDKLGNSKPKDADRFTLTASGGFTKVRDLTEPFAPAQFRNFDDAARLSQPAFVPQDGGIELAAGQGMYTLGTALSRQVRYDVTIVDTRAPKLNLRFFLYPVKLFKLALRGNSAAKSVLSAATEAKMQPFSGKVEVSPEAYAVARVADNKVFHPDGAVFTSPISAQDFLNRAVADDPTLADTLHVLPHFEVAA